MELITLLNSKLFNAGAKAKLDVVSILKEEYGEKLIEKTIDIQLEYGKHRSFLKKVIDNLKKTIYCYIYLGSKDIKIIQYPIYAVFGYLKKPKNRNQVIVIVHDLLGLRKQDEKEDEKEIRYLNNFNYLIIHNEAMKKYLIEKGISEKKLYLLELFDYCCEKGDRIQNKFDENKMTVAYVGTLEKEKCPFIYQLKEDKMNFNMNLYGKGNEKLENHKMIYKGSKDSAELPNKIEGNIGLVWDGNFDESDEYETYKNYTRYNNPHKLSCYIAAGLPVIVWRKSAVADFVKKYNIGYTISNIYDINNLNFQDYEEKKKNVEELSNKVREGYFTKKVIKKILEDMGVNNE